MFSGPKTAVANPRGFLLISEGFRDENRPSRTPFWRARRWPELTRQILRDSLAPASPHDRCTALRKRVLALALPARSLSACRGLESVLRHPGKRWQLPFFRSRPGSAAMQQRTGFSSAGEPSSHHACGLGERATERMSMRSTSRRTVETEIRRFAYPCSARYPAPQCTIAPNPKGMDLRWEQVRRGTQGRNVV